MRYLDEFWDWIILRKFNRFYKRKLIKTDSYIKAISIDDLIKIITKYYKKMDEDKLSREKVKLKLGINSYINMDFMNYGAIIISIILAGVSLATALVTKFEHLDIDEWMDKMQPAFISCIAFTAVMYGINFRFNIKYEKKFDMMCLDILEDVEKNKCSLREDDISSFEDEINNDSNKRKSLARECLNKIRQEKTFIDEEEYNDTNELYLTIRNAYINEFKDKNIDIKVEKIRVEREIGKYQTESMKYSLSMIVGIMASAITIIIQGILSTIKVLPMYIMTPLTVIIVLFVLMRQADKSLKEDKISGLENHIRLKVLNELEKKIEYNNNTSNTILEVASTKETEEKNKDDK